LNDLDSQILNCLELSNVKYIMERSTHLKDKNVEWDKELSLGEQQRLAFSRLFFHKPKFAILDESSSALDSINEDIVYSNCKKLGITLISVAHR
jgi:ABC-type uncharacterized transport system fused permease/ATPase subunit